MSYCDPNRGEFRAGGAGRYMRAAGGTHCQNTGTARPRPRTAAAGDAASLSPFFPLVCGVVFAGFFPSSLLANLAASAPAQADK